MVWRIMLFLTLAIVVLLGGYGYLGMRLIGPLRLDRGANILAWVLLYGQIPLFAAAQWVRVSGRAGALGDALAWLAFTCLGLFAIAFGLVVARDLGWLAARVAGALPPDPERRALLLRGLSLGVVGLTGTLGAWGITQVLRAPRVARVEVPTRGLSKALDGFRVVQISDLHVGPTIRRAWVEQVVARANDLQADLVAVTGDLVDGPIHALADDVSPLAQLASRHGTFFVTGNHEFYPIASVCLA